MDYLRGTPSLLVLDNCEHLIETCAQLSDHFLHACPKLKIIASSREALGINGETVYHVPSLSLPQDVEDLQDVESLMNYEATRLFTERAIKANPQFTLKKDNAPYVAQICERLDGIPLAIELAAARLKLFMPQQIAERLDDRFKLLTGGSRTALPHQQTLRALIDWSYLTLNETEQDVLRRLAVFSGGWTFALASWKRWMGCPDWSTNRWSMWKRRKANPVIPQGDPIGIAILRPSGNTQWKNYWNQGMQ